MSRLTLGSHFVKKTKIFEAGGLPSFRNFYPHLIAFVVTVPVAAVAKADKIDCTGLVVFGQRQVRTLPNRIDVVNGYTAPYHCRMLVHTVPAPAFLLVPNVLAKPFPVSRHVESMQIILGDQ